MRFEGCDITGGPLKNLGLGEIPGLLCRVPEGLSERTMSRSGNLMK